MCYAMLYVYVKNKQQTTKKQTTKIKYKNVCYMLCDVICFAMLYALRCYMSMSKHNPQKNKKQKKRKWRE